MATRTFNLDESAPTREAPRKVIKYFRRNQYGVEREFVHPDNAGDGNLIIGLTGQKTIDGRIRELIRDLSAGSITFQEVIAP